MSRVTQAHIDSRKESILAAALDLFSARGLAATTMQDVAAATGISVGAIYRYYPGKEDLIRAVFERIHESDRQLYASAGQESANEALLNVGRVVTESLRGESVDKQTILILEALLAGTRIRGKGPPGESSFMEEDLDLIERLVRRAQAAGGLDPAIDSRAFAVILLSCVLGVRVLALDMRDRVDMDSVFEALRELLFRFAPSGGNVV